MKVFIAKYDPEALGGGHTFNRNFVKAMGDRITYNYGESDIYFISSASQADPAEVDQAKLDGKKIVLRCDNVVRNSRNRNTGMSRMKKFADMADLVVFQSHFAEGLLNPFLRTENFRIILNSADTDIFNTSGRIPSEKMRFMYSKHSSDETKNWEMARTSYQLLWAEYRDKVFLNLAGRFDAKVQEYNFDFFNGEQFKFWGHLNDPYTLAGVYKNSDVFLYSYFNDACSNTLIEAICCGLDVENCFNMINTGGASEIMAKRKVYGLNYFALDRMRKEYEGAFNVFLS